MNLLEKIIKKLKELNNDSDRNPFYIELFSDYSGCFKTYDDEEIFVFDNKKQLERYLNKKKIKLEE